MNEWQMNPRMNERTERPAAGIRESGDENANPGGSSGADGGISEVSGSPIPAGGSGSEPRLLARLAAYCASDALPMHMPGHKRNRQALQLPEPVGVDITEIDGFDNLHGAEDLLLACQRRAARVFGAEETHFLVNGSSGGILSAIAACVPRGGALLMGRNAHRAALNAVTIGGIRPEYLYPAFLPESGISGAIAPEQVDAALGRRPDIRCVFITSPTYEGVISDVAAIADACHRHGAVLIVDEAHGAHLGFGGFPESAVRLGADVSVQSVHKTLGSLTQTALLHVSGPRVDRERLRRMLSVYQTSSPSYVLMASIDECVLRMEAQGDALADRWLANVAAFRRAVGGLRHLKLLPVEAASCSGAAVGAGSVDGATARGGSAVGADSSGNVAARGGAAVGADSVDGAAAGAGSVDGVAFRFDSSKIVISARGTNIGGPELQRMLRERFHIEMEMAAGHYAIAMTGIGDTEASVMRLADALLTIDAELTDVDAPAPVDPLSPRPQMVLTPAEADLVPAEDVPVDAAAGRTCAETVFAYPPGIPLMVPGERVDGALLARLLAERARGVALHSQTGGLPEVLRCIQA